MCDRAGARSAAALFSGCCSSPGWVRWLVNQGRRCPDHERNDQRTYGLQRGACSEPTQHPDVATMAVSSQLGPRSGGLSSRYSCKGADLSPAVTWAGTPPSTKEIVVVVRTLSRGSLQTNWAVAGISPSVGSLRVGQVPQGAVVGRNSFGASGYRLCPPHDKQALIITGVYALSTPLRLRAGFGEGPIIEAAGSPDVAWGSTSLLVGGRPVGRRVG